MSKIVNLRQSRKSKLREEARAKADANAARHGRTKEDKAREAAEAKKAARQLDGHQLNDK